MIFQKYKNKPVYYDPQRKVVVNGKGSNLIRFDSLLELHTYIELQKHFKNVPIEVHSPVRLLPDKNWKVDFKLALPYDDIYFESKGFITPEFRLQMQVLRHTNKRVFDNLFLVTNNQETLNKLSKLVNYAILFKDLRSFLANCKIAF